jgi:hypothetical protein
MKKEDCLHLPIADASNENNKTAPEEADGCDHLSSHRYPSLIMNMLVCQQIFRKFEREEVRRDREMTAVSPLSPVFVAVLARLRKAETETTAGFFLVASKSRRDTTLQFHILEILGVSLGSCSNFVLSRLAVSLDVLGHID